MAEVSHKLEGPAAPEVEIEPLEWANELVLIQVDNIDAWISCEEDSAVKDLEEFR